MASFAPRVESHGSNRGMTTSSQAWKLWRLVGHWAGSAVLVILFSKFAFNIYHRWAQTGSLILLGLFLYNTLLITVTIVRRASTSTSNQIKDWIAALVTVGISLLFRPGGSHFFAQVAGSSLQGVGLLVMVVALATLGRSFGIVAANRGIKRSGIYGWVRHPLYAGEFIFFTGFLVANFSPYNLILWFGVLIGLCLRAWAEEDLLSQDPEYQTYMQAVPYSFFPGLF